MLAKKQSMIQNQKKEQDFLTQQKLNANRLNSKESQKVKKNSIPNSNFTVKQKQAQQKSKLRNIFNVSNTNTEDITDPLLNISLKTNPADRSLRSVRKNKKLDLSVSERNYNPNKSFKQSKIGCMQSQTTRANQSQKLFEHKEKSDFLQKVQGKGDQKKQKELKLTKSPKQEKKSQNQYFVNDIQNSVQNKKIPHEFSLKNTLGDSLKQTKKNFIFNSLISPIATDKQNEKEPTTGILKHLKELKDLQLIRQRENGDQNQGIDQSQEQKKKQILDIINNKESTLKQETMIQNLKNKKGIPKDKLHKKISLLTDEQDFKFLEEDKYSELSSLSDEETQYQSQENFSQKLQKISSNRRISLQDENDKLLQLGRQRSLSIPELNPQAINQIIDQIQKSQQSKQQAIKQINTSLNGFSGLIGNQETQEPEFSSLVDLQVQATNILLQKENLASEFQSNPDKVLSQLKEWIDYNSSNQVDMQLLNSYKQKIQKFQSKRQSIKLRNKKQKELLQSLNSISSSVFQYLDNYVHLKENKCLPEFIQEMNKKYSESQFDSTEKQNTLNSENCQQSKQWHSFDFALSDQTLLVSVNQEKLQKLNKKLVIFVKSKILQQEKFVKEQMVWEEKRDKIKDQVLNERILDRRDVWIQEFITKSKTKESKHINSFKNLDNFQKLLQKAWEIINEERRVWACTKRVAEVHSDMVQDKQNIFKMMIDLNMLKGIKSQNTSALMDSGIMKTLT